MGYYAAGGYYSAGGFSFKKLVKSVSRLTSFVAKTPIINAAVSLVPGANVILSTAAQVSNALTVPAAHAASQPGTPGLTSFVAARGRGRRRPTRRRRRVWAWA
jgi:hypothetical protein